MNRHLNTELSDFMQRIMEHQKSIDKGAPNLFYLVVPVEETRDDGVLRTVKYLKVIAPTYERAVDIAREGINDSCFSARLRGDIISGGVFDSGIREANQKEKKKCREYELAPQ